MTNIFDLFNEEEERLLAEGRAEIAEDTATYDAATALLAMNAIDRFVAEAPAASKERLFDILREKTND